MKKEEIENYIRLLNDVRQVTIRSLENEFKNALFSEYGMDRHPKREKAFKMAWERGHSCGYGEVESEFMDLADLLVGE